MAYAEKGQDQINFSKISIAVLGRTDLKGHCVDMTWDPCSIRASSRSPHTVLSGQASPRPPGDRLLPAGPRLTSGSFSSLYDPGTPAL